MAEKKSIIDFAYPGDIVGLHDAGNFKIGDTFTEGEKLKFTGIPSFSPELFRYIENAEQLADFKRRKHANMAKDKHDRDVFLADTSYALALAQEKFPDIKFHFTSEF